MSEEIKVQCPECRCLATVPAEWTGKKIRCGECEHVFVAVEYDTSTDNDQPVTGEKDFTPLTFGQCILYAVAFAGATMPGYMNSWFKTYLIIGSEYVTGTGGTNILENIVTGVSIGSVFIALYLAYRSDVFRAKHGHRKLYIICSSILVSASLILLFNPILKGSGDRYAIPAGICLLIFRSASRLISILLLAVLPVLAQNTRQRVGLAIFAGVGSSCGFLISEGLDLFVLTTTGHSSASIIIAFLSFICIFFPYTILHEARLSNEADSLSGDFSPRFYSFVESIMWSFRNRAFLIFSAVTFLMSFSMATSQELFPYFFTKTNLVHTSPLYWLGLIVIFGIVGIFLLTSLVQRIKKTKIYSILLLILTFLSFSILIYLYDSTDIVTELVLVAYYISTIVIIGLLGILANTVICDITDNDFSIHGFGREAVFFAQISCVAFLSTRCAGYAFNFIEITTIRGITLSNTTLLITVACIFACGIAAFLLFRLPPVEQAMQKEHFSSDASFDYK